MSLNQFSQPNVYLPAVEFNEAKINTLTTTTQLLPCSFASDATATPDQKVSMYADGTNTVLKLATNLPGEGCFVQMSNPNADIDMRVGVTNTNECFILAKNDIKIVDENFNLSLTLHKVPGFGITLQNPLIASYTPSNLSVYGTKSYTAVALAGFSVPTTCDLKFTRIGNIVTLTVSTVDSTTDGNPVSVPPGVVEGVFVPANSTRVCIPTTSLNSILETGVLLVQNNGELIFNYTPSSGYAAGPNSGWSAFSVSYHI
jgi:hypothetical protein